MYKHIIMTLLCEITIILWLCCLIFMFRGMYTVGCVVLTFMFSGVFFLSCG